MQASESEEGEIDGCIGTMVVAGQPVLVADTTLIHAHCKTCQKNFVMCTDTADTEPIKLLHLEASRWSNGFSLGNIREVMLARVGSMTYD